MFRNIFLCALVTALRKDDFVRTLATSSQNRSRIPPVPPDRLQLDTIDPRYRILVTDDGSRSLHDTILNESYHSGSGAAAESYVVYIRNSNVESLLSPDRTTRCFEYGLGTAMNFVMTASLAQARNAPLFFESWEHSLLPAEVFEQLELPTAIRAAQNLGWLTECGDHASSIVEQWLAFRKSLALTPEKGVYDCHLGDRITLKLVIGDATTLSADDYSESFDAIYFDAFSPQSNPELWTTSVLTSAHRILSASGRLVTYCVNSHVRQLMTSCGFRVTKGPGPPKGKREVMIAFRE